MKKKRKLGRKLLSFLLTLAMVVGLMPGMSMTVHADGQFTIHNEIPSSLATVTCASNANQGTNVSLTVNTSGKTTNGRNRQVKLDGIVVSKANGETVDVTWTTSSQTEYTGSFTMPGEDVYITFPFLTDVTVFDISANTAVFRTKKISVADTYTFETTDAAADTRNKDPYGYLYYKSSTGATGYTDTYNDDGGVGYNFKIDQSLPANTYCHVGVGHYSSSSLGTIELYSGILPSVAPGTLNLEYGDTSASRTLTVTPNMPDGYVATYQWYKSTIKSTSSGSEISGATDATYSIPLNEAVSSTKYYYYCKVQATKGGVNLRSFSNIAEVSINKATVTITAKDQSIYVGGTVPTLEGADFYTVTGLLGDDTLTTAPTLVYQKEGTAVTPDNTTAGTYDIVPSGASAGNNYNINYVNGTLTINNKQTQTITAFDVIAIYGDTDKSVSATVTTPETGGGAISYAVKEGSEDYIAVNASTGALTIKKTGTATVIVTAAETATYAQASKEVTVTIAKDNITASAAGYTGDYDGNAHGINVSVTKPASGANIKYRVGDGEGYDLTEAPSFTDAGTHTVYYEITAEHYNTKEGSTTITINKLPLIVTADAKQKIYGEDDPAPTYTSVGLLENEGFTGALGRAEGENAGTYAINQGDLSAGNNYEITYTPALFTIHKADVSGPDPVANELTYNKTEQALVTVGATVGGAMQFSTDGESYSVEVPTGKDAGQYTVYYKVVPDDNHNGTDAQQVTVTILPKALTITADAKSKVYGEDDPTLTYTSEGLVDGDVIEGSLARDEGENAGDYVIRKGTLSAGENYQINYTEKNLTITKADPSITTEPAAKLLLFNGASQALISAGETEDGAIQYALGEDDTMIPAEGWDTVIPSAVAPGPYYVWYKVIGDTNHNDTAPVCIPAAIGIIEDITAQRPNPYGTKIENSSEVKTLLGITDAEQTLGVDVWLDIQDASGTVSESDKNIILDAREDYEIGQYLNVNLFKRVGNNEPIHITETNGKIRVSIVIPESLRRTDRIFAVIRIHNGVPAILPGTYDASTGIFTFETDLFSTYAIIYKDIDDDDGEPVQVVAAQTPAQPRSPKTDDALKGYSFWMMLAAAGLAVSGMAAKGRKKEQE